MSIWNQIERMAKGSVDRVESALLGIIRREIRQTLKEEIMPQLSDIASAVTDLQTTVTQTGTDIQTAVLAAIAQVGTGSGQIDQTQAQAILDGIGSAKSGILALPAQIAASITSAAGTPGNAGASTSGTGSDSTGTTAPSTGSASGVSTNIS